MIKPSTRLAASTAALLGLMSPAFGEIMLNENFTVSGYIAGAYTSMDPDPGPAADTLGINSAQVLFKADYAPVTAVTSLYYVPNAAPDETTVLDAYATYTTAGGVAITGGQFLSYLGYESFFNINNPFISFANGDFLGAIPAYHSGLKFDASAGGVGMGIAVLDSVYGGSIFHGDGELKTNTGFEGYLNYTGVEGLTLFGGVAVDNDNALLPDDVITFNFWGSYDISDTMNVAAEYTDKDGGAGGKGYNWLAQLKLALTPQFSLTGRLSGEDIDGGASFMKYSIAPGFEVTEHLTVRAEYSYQDYKDFALDSAQFFGIQGFVKF